VGSAESTLLSGPGMPFEGHNAPDAQVLCPDAWLQPACHYSDQGAKRGSSALS